MTKKILPSVDEGLTSCSQVGHISYKIKWKNSRLCCFSPACSLSTPLARWILSACQIPPVLTAKEIQVGIQNMCIRKIFWLLFLHDTNLSFPVWQSPGKFQSHFWNTYLFTREVHQLPSSDFTDFVVKREYLNWPLVSGYMQYRQVFKSKFR